MGGSQPR